MNKERLVGVFEYYEDELSKRGLEPINRLDGGDAVDHVMWMVIEAKKFASEGRIEKANRWLGFIQGVLWNRSIFTIEEMKDHNRSDR